MEKILNVAEYIFKEYQRVTGEYIDEMKLQKLLYFSQRESLAILNKPMFSEKFEGWKYGPVSREVRTYFTQEDGIQTYTEDIKSENKYSKDQLRLLRNTLYAEKGYIFTGDLKGYFNSKPWYHGHISNQDSIPLSSEEKVFVDAIKKYESQ